MNAEQERTQGAEVEGTVIEVLPSLMYRVQLPDGKKILAHPSDRVRLNLARIIPGDRVVIRLSPYDSSRGRITARTR